MLSTIITLLMVTTVSGDELLKNPGFESLSDWNCWDIHCSLTSDSHSGLYAMQATGRNNYYEGPSQDVDVSEEHIYKAEAWVRVLNDNGQPQNVQIALRHTSMTGERSYHTLSEKTAITTHNGWVHLYGHFVAPSDVDFTKFYFQGPDPGINFAVDTASLKDLYISQGNWESEANGRIEEIRKNNIHVTVTKDDDVDANSVTLEFSQTSHSFPFGTAVVAKVMNNNNSGSDQKYRQFIYDHFNWAVLENALKWDLMEPTRGDRKHAVAENAIKHLREHGINVRAHNLLWGKEKYVPIWLRSLPNHEIEEEIHNHVHDMVTRYKGLVEHWDVNNELLHGYWYEDKLNDPDYTKKIFQLVRQYDSNVILFLNEYDVVAGGGSNYYYRAQANDFKLSSTHVGGLGVQCHFNGIPNPALIKIHLDELAQAGLPIWATELDVVSDDEHQRADWYETIYRILFSHPSIEGILLWGFWSENNWKGEAASLVSGPEFRVNAAGNRFLHLINEEWRTRHIHHLSQGIYFTFRGFYGDYEVKVKVNGDVVHTQHFTLGKSDNNINVHVPVTYHG